MKKVSNQTRIVMAAIELDKVGTTPFTAEELVVATWTRDKDIFGLAGFTDLYPDSNKVLWNLMGEKGLEKRGLLAKVGPKMYELTKEGRLSADTNSVSRLPTIKVGYDKFVSRLRKTTALQKISQGKRDDITFPDACEFWHVSKNDNGTLDRKLHDITTTFRELEEELVESKQMQDGSIITDADVRVIHNLHQFMVGKFERHLKVLKRR